MITYQIDDLGVATLTWDMAERSQNVLNGESCAALFAAIDKAANDEAVKAILMTSAKADFVAGGDLEWLLAAKGADELFARTLDLRWAAAWKWRWPAITASPRTTRKRASACPKSRSVCCPVAVARSACRV
jgi:enoyl-CoA hydratase/carnithine racemase